MENLGTQHLDFPVHPQTESAARTSQDPRISVTEDAIGVMKWDIMQVIMIMNLNSAHLKA